MAQWTGGEKLKEFQRKVRQAKVGSVSVDVGFFSDAKYPDGTPVAAVAAWQEFGNRGGASGGGWGGPIPERPFFRNAIRGADEDLVPILRNGIDPKTMELDRRTAARLGAVMAGRIQKSITTLRQPANAPTTVALKGSSNPLIDIGTMRASVSSRINED